MVQHRDYLLKIQLVEIEPKIYRRFVVPGSITLDRLHDVIQIVMGWEDRHLYDFTIGKKRYTDEPESKEDGQESGKFRLVDLIKKKGRTFQYRYDFGDCWDHIITIEDSQYINPKSLSAVDRILKWTPVECLDGARACPPEDIGGVPGYYEFCEAMKDLKHVDHEKYKTWFAGDFDSEKFDVHEVNQELIRYLRWSRDRYHPWGFLL